MKILNLKFVLNLLFICMLIGFTHCTEDQVIPEQEITITESQSKSGSGTTPNPAGTISRTQLISTVYVRWDPRTLSPRKDEIRAQYSDKSGNMYLVSYTVCPNDPHVEVWQVIFNLIVPPYFSDKTPDPLSTIPDEDDEMEKPTYNNLCDQLPIQIGKF